MKVLTVIGARPQFIKASVVSKAISETNGIDEIIVHTGQHYDENMSDVFFNELNIPRPHYQLNVKSSLHGEMTGRMLEEIEQILLKEKTDRMLVYGDTNSTLAGALAASKLHVPVAHVEAGLRSYNRHMPEEINRILTDQISDILFCPTKQAVLNLENEGFQREGRAKILEVGDVMQDASLLFAKKAIRPAGVKEDGFLLATCHRAENTDDKSRLRGIVDSLNLLHEKTPVVLPLHPRTKNLLQQFGLKLNVHVIDPVGYLEMIWLLQHCKLVLTDSGGVQKEAFFFQKPCMTLRDQTEWVELVDLGVNILAGADQNKIVQAYDDLLNLTIDENLDIYGGGHASQKITQTLIES